MQQVSGHAGATGLMPPPATQTTNGPQQQQPNATAFVFRKAVKQNAKLRLALSGPGGSGKTYTLLKLATALGGRIAAIDTEHFWMGEGGELDQVDAITARTKSNNSFAAWRHVSPMHNRMIDAMLAAPIHIMVSMRVKTEWVLEKDERTGKTVPRKVGLAPVMRDGVEYEFDVCG